MKTAVLTVPDIECEHCERAITQALSPVDGVKKVAVDVSKHEVEVHYDEGQVDVEQMEAILRDEDYPVASARTVS